MSDRLTSADLAFFYVEGPTTPQHVGGLAVFDAPDGLDYDRLVRLLDERISLAPRYRQRMRAVPCNLANPVWVDDPDFDITYHVRRSALPRPGGEADLLEFCARILSRVLDRDRPLWEMYLVEGLSGGRVAIVTKTHPSMVDGLGSIDITEVLLDESPEPRRTVPALWMPQPVPSRARMVGDAVTGVVRRPAQVVDAARLTMRHARPTVGWVASTLGQAVTLAHDTVTRSARSQRVTPLRTTLSRHRRIALGRAELADLRRVRELRGGTVNDVVLTVVTGALRSWLLARGEALSPATTVRALAPISVSAPDLVPSGAPRGAPGGWSRGARVVGRLVDLPVGEADPLRRLAQMQYAMAALSMSDRPVGANALVALGGFAPPTLHSLGVRAAHGLTRRMYSVTVTNVPGPQQPLYAAGARLREMFPILPLNEGQALSIGVTSYDGGVFFGLNGDRDAVPDLADVATLVEAAVAELLAASTPVDIEPGRRTRRRTTT